MQSLSLYNLGTEHQILFNNLYDHETGEINEEVDAQLGALTATVEKKCTAIGSWIKKIESEKREIEFLKNEILSREKAFDKEINKWQSYLKNNMERCGMTEVKCPYFTIKLKKNPFSTEIYDESLLPEKFMKTREIVKIEVKADKNAIKDEVLKTGVQIPGATVQQNLKLEIITDKL